MIAIKFLLFCLLVVLAQGLSGKEEQLSQHINKCCKNSCSNIKLEELTGHINSYARSENANKELVDFGVQVLGGKRCDEKDTKQVRSARKEQVRAVNNSTTITGGSTTGRNNSTSGSQSTTGEFTTGGSTNGNSNSTSGYSTTTGGNGHSIYLSCPTSVSYVNQYYTCTVYASSPNGIQFVQVGGYCSVNCYNNFYGQKSVSFQATFYIDGSSTYAYAYMYVNNNGYYIYSDTVYVQVNAPLLQLDRFSGPSILSPGFSNANVLVDASSYFPISTIAVIYYNEQLGYAAQGFYYSNGYYNSSNNGIYTSNASIPLYNYGQQSGRFCAQVFLYDTRGFRTVANGSCFEIVKTGCNAGYYSSLNKTTNQFRCLPCPVGFYSSSPDSLSCTACSPGQTSSCVLGSRSCVNCPVGTSSSQGICKPCNSGSYAYYEGQQSCTFCNPGQYANSTGNTKCLNCNPGSFSNSGASSCTTCPAGSYAASYGSSICNKCYDGYSSLSGSSFCNRCPENTFAISGDAKCTPCPAGQTSPSGSYTCYEARK